jgi:hypothetical protein
MMELVDDIEPRSVVMWCNPEEPGRVGIGLDACKCISLKPLTYVAIHANALIA